ncbi:MAG TPA: DUF5683 domain-containing protein [Chitinispirillaceae bacterium]|nr:DUF5683 domain-containing protein [Chitinispirillaceae bacterium]
MKVLFIAVTLFFSITFAEDSTSENQMKSGVGKAAIATEDEELILGDDEDIQKASKQGSLTTDTTAQTSAPVTSGTANGKAEVKVEDELKLDGEEENILEPVKQEFIAADTSTVKGAISVNPAQVSDTTTATQSSDTSSSPSGVRPRVSIPQPSETVFIKKNAEPQNVGATGSINFARNLNDYRSPKLAMLMSLIVPGSGQVYAAHHSWKAAIYGAVEVGMIATSAVLRSKGIKKEKDAHKFADQHYSFDKYMTYQNALKTKVDSATYSNIFFGSDSFFLTEARGRNEQYYEKIKENDQPFVNGWDDAKPEFDANLIVTTDNYHALGGDSSYLVYYQTDTANAYYGFSDNQRIFKSKISKSGSYFQKSGIVLAFMLVNHLVSAIDAGLTAKAHNDLLLNKKSVWNHIGLEQISLSDGSTMVPGYALKVRF